MQINKDPGAEGEEDLLSDSKERADGIEQEVLTFKDDLVGPAVALADREKVVEEGGGHGAAGGDGEKQAEAVAEKMGGESEAQVRALIKAGGLPAPEQQLPLLEIAFPALKRRPPDFVTRVLDTGSAMINADGRIDVFEYLLARVISMHLWESQNPHRVRSSGSKTISSCLASALDLLAILARHGSTDPKAVSDAFAAIEVNLCDSARVDSVIVDDFNNVLVPQLILIAIAEVQLCSILLDDFPFDIGSDK